MSVNPVGATGDDRLRMQLRDLLPDSLRQLLWIDAAHAAVGVVPQLDRADGQSRSGLLELSRANLREIFLDRATWLSHPARLPASGADQVYRYSRAAVPQDQAAATHRLIVGMRHHHQ